jgi:hypothetical protein
LQTQDLVIQQKRDHKTNDLGFDRET